MQSSGYWARKGVLNGLPQQTKTESLKSAGTVSLDIIVYVAATTRVAYAGDNDTINLIARGWILEKDVNK